MPITMNSTLSTTSTSTPATYLNKTYYDRKPVERCKDQVQACPERAETFYSPRTTVKRLSSASMNCSPPAPTAIVEGVVKDGQKIEQSHVGEATVEQYGFHVMVTDVLEMTAFDPVVDNMVELLGEQLGTSPWDWVTRDAMNAGSNVQYAGGNASKRLQIEPADKLTTVEIRKAVRHLKKAKARPFTRNGREHFICICSPDATFDLQTDQLWQDVSKYSNAEQIYTGEIPALCSAWCSSNPPKPRYSPPSVANAVKATTDTATTFVLKNAPTDAEVEYLSEGGNKIYINGTEKTLAASDPFNATTNTVTLSEAATLTANHLVYSEDAGAVDSVTKVCCDVHSALVYGQEAVGTIDIANGGNMRTIIKPKGSAGTADPYDQFSTIGQSRSLHRKKSCSRCIAASHGVC